MHFFAQIAKLIPRHIVKIAAKLYRTDSYYKKHDTFTHLLAFILCHLGACQSLHDISNGLRSSMGNLNHLGIKGAPSRNGA
ncbi:MAG: DUF4372 domain-containing protein [Akkermansia sp.]|nr:DUF4372 domain-containing protein [Akkermansia sp.]